MTTDADRERFQSGAHKYTAYLETPEGRLRSDLAFANLQEFLPQSKPPLRCLDLGGGTGATAVRLARLGLKVTLFDSSPAMLDIASRAAQAAGIIEKVALKQGDADELARLFAGESFDVILCHNVLEFVDCPSAVLSDSVRLMRHDPPALLSILVRNRAGDVLKAAIQAGDLEAAERNLTADWGVESLYRGRVRLFAPDELVAMLKEARLEIIAERGVRVVADYLPPQVSRESAYQPIFELERKLGRLPEFAAIARYTHYLARCT